MATCAQKHHTHIAVFCVTSNGRERAYINLYMHFSRLCLRVFPYSSAMYPYYISVKNLSNEHVYILSPFSTLRMFEHKSLTENLQRLIRLSLTKGYEKNLKHLFSMFIEYEDY